MSTNPLDLLTPAQIEWRKIKLDEITRFLQRGESHAQGANASGEGRT